MTGHHYGAGIFPQHAAMLSESGVDPAVARERGVVSVDTKATLEKCDIAAPGRQVPGLLFPIHGVDGVVSYQYRPDEPRLNGDGKPVKYETPYRRPLHLDLHPRTHEHLRDPSVPVIITEGVKKVDALLSVIAAADAKFVVVGLLGVWSWRGKDHATGGKVALPDWHDIALNGRDVFVVFDHDVQRKKSVRTACTQLAGFLRSKGATPWFLWLPMVNEDPKTGVDDYLAAGGNLAELAQTATAKFTPPAATTGSANTGTAKPATATYPAATRADVHAVFTKWFGPHYDLQYLDIVLAGGAAGIHLNSNPLWLQVIGGSGVAKTETTASLEVAGAMVVSILSGPAALLSGTSSRERAEDATGGLLRVVGERGVLVIKDFTSILSMAREKRAEMLAALREVFDGVYVRSVGSDGGQTLEWRGRLAVVSCVTGAYDEHHAVIAAMGERFLLLRLDSENPDVRLHATRQALRNGGSEDVMRREMSHAVAGLLTNIAMPANVNDIDDTTLDELVTLADVVSLARSQVARDAKGDPEYAHAPEMPTRIAQQLRQLLLGCRLVGMNDAEAMEAVRRVARDTIPPDRRQILLALHDHIDIAVTSKSMAALVGMSRSKVDRTLRELALHGLVRHVEAGASVTGHPNPWTWEPTDTFDLAVLRGPAPRSGKVSTPPVPQYPDTPTATFTPETAGSGLSTSGGKGMDDISGMGRPEQMGPCIGCGEATRRYGPGASPKCTACREHDDGRPEGRPSQTRSHTHNPVPTSYVEVPTAGRSS